MNKKIAIIGAGAAGCFAAIQGRIKNPAAEIVIYEASSKALSKVQISGGGRCNVTTSTKEINDLIENYPRGSKELRSVFSRFSVEETIEWFESRGVKLKTEADGRMFPETDKSYTITNCLKNELDKLNVQIVYHHKALEIFKTDNQFKINFFNKDSQIADKVILTSGSNSDGYKIVKSLNHTLIEPNPSLFTFEIKDKRLDSLSGISFENVELKLNVGGKKFKQTGPLLITHWGLSGPAVIKLSAFAARALFSSSYSGNLAINFFPNIKRVELKEILDKQKAKSPNKIIKLDSFLDLPKRYWEKLLLNIGVHYEKKWSELSNKNLDLLLDELQNAQFKIIGKGKFKEEFVTAGGVNLKEVEFKTMESKVCPGLYFAGEILNIDGITGGYNFQSAWSTGWIAGSNI